MMTPPMLLDELSPLTIALETWRSVHSVEKTGAPSSINSNDMVVMSSHMLVQCTPAFSTFARDGKLGVAVTGQAGRQVRRKQQAV
jgi:hypothetical protein